MASEYFWPHDLGGSEWSTFYLAKELTKKGHQVIIITPNYGSKDYEILGSLKVFRFPFFRKIKGDVAMSPFWHTNIIWVLLSTFYLIKICKKEKVDILHLQGKYYTPAGFFAKKLINIPVILTTRDYQLICNYGFCIWEKTKSCNLIEYFSSDFRQYVKQYLSSKSQLNIALNILFAVRARLIKSIFNFFAKQLDLIICISNAQAGIYRSNGFKNITIINNSMEFEGIKETRIGNYILFAGRLTPGKGIDLLLRSLPRVFKKYMGLKIYIIGEGFMKNKLLALARRYGFEKNVSFLGEINHKRLLEMLSRAKIAVVPSVWPEPFGRVALESLSQGTPVVVTKRGGLPEIIEDSQTGYICQANVASLSSSILKAIKNNKKLRVNINKKYKLLKYNFQIKNIKSYIELYKQVLKK